MFVWILEPYLMEGVGHITHHFLSLPGGIHFQGLNLAWFLKEEILLTTVLMEDCSHTLESLGVTCELNCTSIWHLPPHQ